MVFKTLGSLASLGDGEFDMSSAIPDTSGTVGVYESAPSPVPQTITLTPVPGSGGTFSMPGASGGANPWSNLLSWGENLAGSVLKAQYGTPQYAPGTYIQTGPSGSIAYRAPSGAGGFFSAVGGGANASVSASGISSTTLLIGGAALVAVLFLSQKR